MAKAKEKETAPDPANVATPTSQYPDNFSLSANPNQCVLAANQALKAAHDQGWQPHNISISEGVGVGDVLIAINWEAGSGDNALHQINYTENKAEWKVGEFMKQKGQGEALVTANHIYYFGVKW